MATSPAADASAVPAKKGKKMIILVAGALLLLAIAGGAGVVILKKSAAAAAHADEDEDAPASKVAADPLKAPTFVPLDPFIVNLADSDSDRYAQIAITLQIDDPKFAERIKLYMPAIRNAILMILAHKTSAELLERAGKEALADEIMREAVRPMGIEIDPPVKAAKAGDDDDDPAPRPRRRKPAVINPIQHVHFANFIIQ